MGGGGGRKSSFTPTKRGIGNFLAMLKPLKGWGWGGKSVTLSWGGGGCMSLRPCYKHRVLTNF